MAAKLKTIKKAMKDAGKCSKCGDEIKKGDPYRYWHPMFRSSVKIKRCMKPECTPKQSELERGKLADAYAAQENALYAIDEATEISDVASAVEDCSSSAQEVIDEYEQSVESMPALEDRMRPTIEALEEWMSGLDSFSPDEPDEEEGQDDDEYQSTLDEALDTAKEEARDLVNALEV